MHLCFQSSYPHPKSTNLFASSGLLLGQRGEPQVRLDDTEVWEELLGLLILDRRVHNHIVTGDPVDGSGNLVLVAGLEGVDDAQDLGRVTASGGWVGQDGADSLLGVDDEDGANGESNAFLVDVGGILVVEPGEVKSVIIFWRVGPVLDLMF